MQVGKRYSSLVVGKLSIESPGGIETVCRSMNLLLDRLTDGWVYLCGGKNSVSRVQGRNLFIQRRILVSIRGAPIFSFGNTKLVWHSLFCDRIIYHEPNPGLWLGAWLANFSCKRKWLLVHADPHLTSPYSHFYRWLRKIIFFRYVVVTTSEILASDLRKIGVSISTIPLGIPEKPLKPASLRELSDYFGFDLPDKYFLFFGRESRYKGHVYFAEALDIDEELVGVSIISGIGTCGTTIDKSRPNHLIIRTDCVPESIKEGLIEHSYAFVFPSTTKNEAFGLIQLEAMRRSKAIINTDIGSGVNEVAPHMLNAVMVDAESALSLAAGMRRLWCDGEMTNELGRAGRQRFLSKYTEHHFLTMWKELLKQKEKHDIEF